LDKGLKFLAYSEITKKFSGFYKIRKKEYKKTIFAG